jgi:hypothetical protein
MHVMLIRIQYSLRNYRESIWAILKKLFLSPCILVEIEQIDKEITIHCSKKGYVKPFDNLVVSPVDSQFSFIDIVVLEGNTSALATAMGRQSL